MTGHSNDLRQDWDIQKDYSQKDLWWRYCNNQKPLLEQAEDAGIPIAHSCRAGLCGACKVTVESGKVHQPDVPGLLDHEMNMGVALACCCVPETDIEVVN